MYGGDGDDEINIESLSGEYITVDGGDGDDSVHVGYSIGIQAYGQKHNFVLLGAGNDKFTASYMSYLSVGGGGGDDCIHAHVLGLSGLIQGDDSSQSDAGDDTIRVGFMAHESSAIFGDDGDDNIEIDFAGDMTDKMGGGIFGDNGQDTLTVKHGWIHERPRGGFQFLEEGEELFDDVFDDELDSSFETVNEPKYNMKTWVSYYADD